MPYNVRKRSCTQSDGDKGTYVLQYKTKKGKNVTNCHTSKKKAQGQIAAIEGPREAATPENSPGYFKGLSKKEKEERERVIARRSKMDDNDPDAYKDFRTDKGKKTKPSSHTKKFKKMFGESGWKALKEVWKETKTLKEAPADKALANKAKKTGIPKGILRQVYNRGLAAWKTGHKPGAPQAAWGMARVNSFATKGKGTWGKADKDLAVKARKAKKKK